MWVPGISKGSKEWSPAELFDGADVDDTIVEVGGEGGHVPGEEHPVRVDRVASQWTLAWGGVALDKLQHQLLCLCQ